MFDLADAAWAHPFCSLVMLLHECLYRWGLPKGEHVLDLRDPRIGTIFDSYFECWTDLASLASLRTLAQYALRIAALQQSRAWFRQLQLADPHTLATQGHQPWHWLQDVTKEVLSLSPPLCGVGQRPCTFRRSPAASSYTARASAEPSICTDYRCNYSIYLAVHVRHWLSANIE